MTLLLRYYYIASALPQVIFKLITYFFARQTIQLALPRYCYRRDLV